MRSDNLAYKLSDRDGAGFIDAEGCYRLAERKAADYYRSLYQQVTRKTYIPYLTKDFQAWKQQHLHPHPVLTFFSGGKAGPDPKDYRRYIQWLDYTGRLDGYLNRSISYIFMRDLGKDPASPDTLSRVGRAAEKLRDYLTRDTAQE